MISASGDGGVIGGDPDDGYGELLAALRAHARTTEGPLFVTDAAGLYDAFLAELPGDARAQYVCATCRRFVERFGGLVAIGPRGEQRAWLWHASGIPPRFAPAVAVMAARVDAAQVVGAWRCADTTWGVAENRSARTDLVWQHLAVEPPAALVYPANPLKTAGQAAAEIAEDRAQLARALDEFPRDAAASALTLLRGGNLYRSEKAESIAAWFVDLHDRVHRSKGAAVDRLVWRAAGTAPPGFTHLRASVLGSLLEDVVAGTPFDVLRARWAAKLDPTQYQRPQAAPTAGNIAAAEKIVAALASAGALARRFARLDDVQALWRPTAPASPPPGGVFSHLRPKRPAARPVDQPPVVMTFAKFRRDVLPDAEQLELRIPERGGFIALTTAVNADAPPILQWDREDRRNPVNWYVYPGGSPASQWGLRPGWGVVTALTLLPSMWGNEDDHSHQGKGVIALLAGCIDQKNAGIALFPEVLKAEYRSIRATLEAHSRGQALAGRDQASACGLDLRAGQTWNQQLRVTDRRGIQTIYTLDRWD